MLDFEKEIVIIEENIAELRKKAQKDGIDLSSEIRQLGKKKTEALIRIYSCLTAWQIVQVARHPQRPIFQDYANPVNSLVIEFMEFHGDRCFGDDRAIIAGLAKIGAHKVMLIGHNKGKTIKEKAACRFGSPCPEGFKKAHRVMKFAEKFGLPVVTLIDTPGAYPGMESEERGVAKAIAENLMLIATLKTPIVCIDIGEGGSGGALGIGIGDKFAMLEHSYFSVISPEGCAGILWREATLENIKEAATALKITSKELMSLGLIDDVIPEPLGGAHRSISETIANIKIYLCQQLAKLKKIPIEKLIEIRQKKLRSLGTQFCKSPA